MSRESDITTILRLIPRPDSLTDQEFRKAFEGREDRELVVMRISLENMGDGAVSPEWRAAIHKVGDLIFLGKLVDALAGKSTAHS